MVAPMAQAMPAKPVPQRFVFSGDALFDFDKSTLKPVGLKMLDGLVTQLGAVTYDSILVVGHTDRFGSDKYNQLLSERRAKSVKDYLVGKNVLATRIEAQGKGETQPTTKPTDCPGGKSAKVIACLQPDRHVDVDVTGMQTLAGAR